MVHSLEDAVLTVADELALHNDGVATGTTTLSSATGTFLSLGIAIGDKVFILGKGTFAVAQTPTLNTQLVLDRVVSAGTALRFSLGKSICSKKRSLLAADYSGSGDVHLIGGSEFNGIVVGSFQAQIADDAFQYTHRIGNTLKGVTGLGQHLKGSVVWQDRLKPEVLFVQNLKVSEKFNRVELPQLRSQAKKKKLLSTEHQIEFSTLLSDLELEKSLGDPNKSYTLQFFYKLPETFQEDGFLLLGCCIQSAGVSNQDNSVSVRELSYSATYGEIFVKE